MEMGFGDPSTATQVCTPPAGYVLDNTDCDDNDANNYPGNTEICDGQDNNCDGVIDEGFDLDGDGFTVCAGDCDDTDATINPGATESCNGIDDNCDGTIDEGVETTYYADVDGDGYGDLNSTTLACLQPFGYVLDHTDCDDTDATINPGATESCNGIDDNCDGTIDEGVETTYYADVDGDGYGDLNATTLACLQPFGYVLDNTDCDDTDATINPGATESCNGIDDNCDGTIDEGVETTYYADVDGDGYGDLNATTLACLQPFGYVLDNTDCDDTDATINPGATESCNGIDDNCDGTIDEGVETTYYADVDGDGYGDLNATTLACLQPFGYVLDNTDCDDTDATINPGATESCNGIDDNCDGTIDEGVETTYYADVDGDGYGDLNATTLACLQPFGYVLDNTDCDDTDATINPGATESCNGIDDNCDGTIDEGVETTYYADVDGDGYGDLNSTTLACLQPFGYVLDNTDCDDTDATINPGATESCNGIDDNCDGTIDEGVETTYYADVDGDGYGDLNATTLACLQPFGYVLDNTDCDDTDATINPGATESCNGIDDNCDGTIDEGVETTYYADVDGDGYGDQNSTTLACLQPFGYVLDNTDCDDTDATINPGATESCNGIDDNCDGTIDEGVETTYYADVDGDGYGDLNATTLACLQPFGYVLDNTDCDDTDATINPGATESCNGIDDNCDGTIDEGVETTYYADVDGDGYGDLNATTLACLQPFGYVLDNTDCDDTDATINPGATESCNGIDDNCDGTIDEGACVGNTCANPIAIGNLPYSYTGTTQHYGIDYTDADVNCTATHLSGEDIVFTYNATDDEVVRVELIIINGPNTNNAQSVYVLDGCPDPLSQPECIGYAESQGEDTTYIETVHFETAGLYYIVVSSKQSFQAWVDFELNIEQTTGNICENAEEITSLPYWHIGSTALYGDDYDEFDACNSQHMTGNDFVYSFTAPRTTDIEILLSDLSDAHSAIHFLDDCPDIAVNCTMQDRPSKLDYSLSNLPVVQGHTYYIVISTKASFNVQTVDYRIDVVDMYPAPAPMPVIGTEETNQSNSRMAGQQQEYSFQVYPNPTSGQLMVNTPADLPEGTLQLYLSAFSGKESLIGEITSNRSNGQQIALPDHLPSGVYVLKFAQASKLLGYERVVLIR